MASSTTFENTAGGSTKLLYNDTSANDYVVELPKETGKLTTEAMAVKLGALGKNYIINGGFDYWNYATSQTSSGYGSDDRWFNNNLGSTKTHSLVNATDTERALFNSSKFSRTVVTSVAGTANNVHKRQLIENVTKLAGKTVTITFWAKADTAKNIAIEMIQNFGTGGTPSTQVTGIGSQLVALTTTWQKKSITVTIPSIVGKTLGTDGVHTSSLFFTLWFDAGSDLNTRTANLGQQSGTFDIAEVKLEEGSVATPWTPYEGEFGGEVQACQRYYENSYTLGTFPGAASPLGANASFSVNSGIAAGFRFRTTKRVVPTMTLYSPAGLVNAVWDVNDSNTASNAFANNAGTSGVRYIGGSFTVTSMITYHYVASAEL